MLEARPSPTESLSREPVSPTTQKEWESSGMKNRGKEESGVKRRDGTGKPLLLSRKVTWLRLMGYHSCLKPTGSRFGNYLAQPQDSLLTPEVLGIQFSDRKGMLQWEENRENHQTFSVWSTDGYSGAWL